ncbi:hypothetical protein SK128_026469 [Halocaridina rubra]|uniref:Uncharacterized protein n=1 Tax=Halocaridina rubra TaxID=373956 RepID=A0AAN8X6N2_HALRR
MSSPHALPRLLSPHSASETGMPRCYLVKKVVVTNDGGGNKGCTAPTSPTAGTPAPPTPPDMADQEAQTQKFNEILMKAYKSPRMQTPCKEADIGSLD